MKMKWKTRILRELDEEFFVFAAAIVVEFQGLLCVAAEARDTKRREEDEGFKWMLNEY